MRPVMLAEVPGSAWRRGGVAALLVVLLTGVSCGSSTAVNQAATSSPTSTRAAATSQPTDAGPDQAHPVPLVLATSVAISTASLYVGVEKGIYLKHGIDLKINLMASGPVSVNALQAGEAQVVIQTWAALVSAAAQGVPIKVFGLVTGRPDVANYDQNLAIVVRPGVTAKTVADLKGLKIGTPFGTAVDVWLAAHLQRAGLNPDSDVRRQNVPVANLLSAMQTQAVDAVAAGEPYGSLITSGVPGSRDLVRGGGISEARITMAALGPWLSQNPVVVDRLLAAHAEAEQYARQHPDDAAVATSHYMSALDPVVLAASLRLIDYDPRWSSKVQDGFQGASQLLFDSGTIKTIPKTTDLLMLDLLSSIQSKNPQFFNDLKY